MELAPCPAEDDVTVHHTLWSAASWFITSNSHLSVFGSSEQGANTSIVPVRGNLSAHIDRDNIPQSQCAIYNKACSRSVTDLEQVQRGAEGAYDSCVNSEICTVHHCSQWKQQNWSATPSIHPPDRPRFIKLAWPIAAVVTGQRGANSAYKYRTDLTAGTNLELWLSSSAGLRTHRTPGSMKVRRTHQNFLLGSGEKSAHGGISFPFPAFFVCL